MTEVNNSSAVFHLDNKGEIYYLLRSRIQKDHQNLMSRVGALQKSMSLNKIYTCGLITISNNCVRNCIHCGYRADRTEYGRFRLSRSEILAAADKAVQAGVNWIVLRCSDDPVLTTETIAEIVRELVTHKGLRITLSLGEKDISEFITLKNAGANSCWIRHETSDPHLYRRLRPSMYWVDRVRAIQDAAKSGLLIGTGTLVGMPNQGYESLVEDILLLNDPKFSAAIVEPYRPLPESPGHLMVIRPENHIVEPDKILMEKIFGITRLLRTDLLLPLTNAHVVNFGEPRYLDLILAGANSLIFDFTPSKHLKLCINTPFIGIPFKGKKQIKQIEGYLNDNDYNLSFDLPFSKPETT